MTRTVLKAMSVFGGVKVLSILCSVVRNKLVAIWLGSAGVGLLGLFVTAQQTIESVAQLQIAQSAVRDISAATTDRDRRRLCAVTRSWGLWLGFLSMALMCALSPLLSLWSFGSTDRAWAFCLLSLALPCTAIADSRSAILQGLRRLRPLARGQAWGTLGGIAVVVPLLYWLRMNSVVWVIVGGAAVMMLSMVAVSRQPGLPRLSRKDTIQGGRDFLRLGLYITISLFLANAVGYAFMSYLSNLHGESAAGLYRAGFTVVNSYVGLVFSAIIMEYYPRLTSQIHSPWRTGVVVSHELRLVLWVLMPVICLFVAFDSLIVRLLYSSEFEPITPYLTLAMGGMVLRAVSWCMVYVVLARGDGRVYVVLESISNLLFLALNILGYNIAGFAGVGVAYILWYLVYALMVAYVFRRRYHLRLAPGLSRLIALALAVTALAVTIRMLL